MTQKDYSSDGITVHWNSARCIHTGICLRALPEVFDVDARPWIDLSGASASAIADAVEKCPTGALTYSAPAIAEVSPRRTEMRPIRGGPMVVRGEVELVDAEGNTIVETRVCLCRCGNSGNQPFCDNSHRTEGFDEPEFRARTDADAPDEVCAPQPGFTTS